ncbi:sigma factor [Streptomyces sp. NRRL F-5053]|uniref:sigma factor n=1 Tax=Streptomyces sp. NRRL F-5053 TaxID=1463854 RepID=UPI00068BD5F1|nr:sigma factor [Streptomyces sp. NRRL F-5053]
MGGAHGAGAGTPEQEELAARFEAQRAELTRLAHGMLGSLAEAEDAVQEAWFRLARHGGAGIANPAAWLRTVLSRICLDSLRARAARPEEPSGGPLPDDVWCDGAPGREGGRGPEDEAVLVEAVGRALLVVLERLGPAERVAFVLHDLFAVPFEGIAPVVDRTPAAAKKLASRARARVRGTGPVPERAGQRRLVEAFLAAAREGDLDGLLAVLAPDVVRRSDPAAVPEGAALSARGARKVAGETLVLARRSRFAAPALVNGGVGVVVAPRGRLLLALTFTFTPGGTGATGATGVTGGGRGSEGAGGYAVGDAERTAGAFAERIAGYEVIADPARLAALELAVPVE